MGGALLYVRQEEVQLGVVEEVVDLRKMPL